jgi:glycosyltransferase involved in cell wall biosynthesis
VLLLHRELIRRGHASAVLAPNGSPLLARCRDEELPAAALPGRRPWSPGMPKTLRSLRAATDILHAHDPHAAALAAFARGSDPPPIVVCHRRAGFPMRRGGLHRLKYHRVDRWIAVTAAIREDLIAWGVAPDRCHTVHSALETERFRKAVEAADPGEVRDDLGLPRNGPLLVAVAALDRQKGIEVLIEAVAVAGLRIPELRALVVGDGPEKTTLQALAADHGDVVRLLGPRDDVPALLAAADLCVVPSLSHEGSSAAAKEALIARRPLVASDLEGLREVAGDAAVWVAPEDPAALADAVVELLGDPERREQIVTAGDDRVEAFRPERTVEGVLEVYSASLRGRSA